MTPMQRFADDMEISIHQARRLKTLVNKAADAQVEEMNEGTDSDEQVNKVLEYANRLGLDVNYSPGLYPLFSSINKGETQRILPD